MHARLIAFTQIEDPADHVDARAAFVSFNMLVLNLIPCKQIQAW